MLVTRFCNEVIEKSDAANRLGYFPKSYIDEGIDQAKHCLERSNFSHPFFPSVAVHILLAGEIAMLEGLSRVDAH